MLNYQTPAAFFENCLYECSINLSNLTLGEVQCDNRVRAAVVRSLQDIRDGADAIFNRGKPAEASLDYDEWSQRWWDWAKARKAAFFSRAALTSLGDTSYYGYFLEILRNSHNIVFLGASNDVLQHATGYYLDGPEEELSKTQLADWWENHLQV